MRYRAIESRNGNWKVISLVPGKPEIPRRVIATFENSAVTIGVLTARYYARKFARMLNREAELAEARQIVTQA